MGTDVTLKRCYRCDTTKPLDGFSVSRTRPDGRQSMCRDCKSPNPVHPEGRLVRGSSRRAHDTVVTWENLTGLRICTECEQAKPLHREFHRDKSARLGYVYRCKPCYREYKRIQQASARAADPEKYRDHVRKNQRQPDFNEKRRIRRAANPHQAAANNARRRGLVLLAEGSFTSEQFTELCAAWGNVCLCCGGQSKLEPDHVIPLSWGGSNEITNIQPLCRSCNSRKGNRHATDHRHGKVL